MTDAASDQVEYKYRLASVKTNTSFALTQLKMNKEPKEELTELRDAIIEALETGRLDNDEEFRAFISTEACNVLCKMAGERSYDQEVSALNCFARKDLTMICLVVSCPLRRCPQSLHSSPSQ